MGENLPRVDQVVRFLQEFAPEDYEQLRKENPLLPQEADLQLGGDSDAALLTIQLKVAAESLRRIDAPRRRVTDQTRGRIQLSRNMSLAGGLIGLLSTGTIITILSQDYPKPMAYAAAMLNLLALGLPAITHHLQALPKGVDTDLSGIWVRLLKCEDEAAMLLPQIEYCVQNGCAEDTQRSLIGAANKLMAETRELVSRILP